MEQYEEIIDELENDGYSLEWSSAYVGGQYTPTWTNEKYDFHLWKKTDGLEIYYTKPNNNWRIECKGDGSVEVNFPLEVKNFQTDELYHELFVEKRSLLDIVLGFNDNRIKDKLIL